MTGAVASARGQRGFTLLEMLIALSIVAIMMTIMWSVTSQIGDDKRHVTDVAQRNHEIRVALTRMVTDISMAYLSGNENTSAIERRTFFVGKESGEYPLRFSAFARTVVWADADESSQTYIAYYIDDDPFERGQKNLLRRSSRRLGDEGWDQERAEVDVLVRNVEDIEFEYWNWQDKEWDDDWDSTSDSNRNRLPSRVRIKLSLENAGGKKIEHITQTRLGMEEVINFQPSQNN